MDGRRLCRIQEASGEIAVEFQEASRARSLRLGIFERVRETVNFTQVSPTLRQHSSVLSKTFLAVISSVGESEPSLPSCTGCCQRDPLLSHPIKNIKCVAQLGLENLGETQILEIPQIMLNILQTPSASMLKNWWGGLTLNPTNRPTGNPTAPFNSHSFPLNSMAGFLHTLSSGSRNQPSQTATEHMQKAAPTLWNRVKPHTLEYRSPPEGKQEKAVSILSPFAGRWRYKI